MDRRPVGVALVVVALAAVMVVPALPGIRSIGTAVPIALPAVPEVGDCVVELSGVVVDPDESPPRIPMDDVRLGSCRGSIAGEVVGFWPDAQALADAPRSRRAGPCYPPMAEFAALNVNAAAPAVEPWVEEPVSWRPTLAYQAYLVTPTDLERRAGRDWSACVVAPPGGGGYRGSLAGAFADGSLPVGFGSCWSPDPAGPLRGPGDCAAPHTAQLLATGWNGTHESTSTADVQASCSRVAGRLIGTEDPTRDGQLAFVADRMGRLTTAWSGNPSSLGCFVTTAGPRQLVGLVTGLGERPVPYAP